MSSQPLDNFPQLSEAARAYHKRWSLAVLLIDPDGVVLRRWGTRAMLKSQDWQSALRFALEQSLQWGEVTILPGPDAHLVWAAPLMVNARLVGGLASRVSEDQTLGVGGAMPPATFQQASTALRQVCEMHNATNAALLAERREQYRLEKQKAEAIHVLKTEPITDLRQVYWREEPQLLSAIRRGDPEAAREVLNRMLVVLLHRSTQHIDMLKSFLMELAASVCRTATEAGADPAVMLDENMTLLRKLESTEDLNAISRWLHEMLEQVFDRIGDRAERRHDAIIADALAYMREHCINAVGRDDIARAVHLSPWYFSRLFKQHTGQSVSDMLRQMRLNRAAEQLARTDRAISDIAIACGFADQAQLTRLMRRHTGQTPRGYRLQFQSDK